MTTTTTTTTSDAIDLPLDDENDPTAAGDEETPAPARRLAAFRAQVAAWPGFTRQATPVAEVWRLSAVIDINRVPAKSELLAFLWWIDRWTGRPLLFLLMQIAPAFCMGPLLWIARRPSRRLGLYTIAAIIAVTTAAG